MKHNQSMTKKVIIVFSIMTAAVICLAGSALARGHGHMPPGLDKKTAHDTQVQHEAGSQDAWIQPVPSPEQDEKWKDGRPPGWSHGKKTGWGDSDMPPGLSKKKGYHHGDDEVTVPGQPDDRHETEKKQHKHKHKHGKGHKGQK